MSDGQWPARYEIRVEGELDHRWSEWLEGFTIRVQAGHTILSGTLPDQPALHGVFDQIRDLGLCIVTVRRLPPDRSEGEGHGRKGGMR